MRSLSTLHLSLLLSGLVLLSPGCRPAIESRIPCATGGDLSCPTGWHCGPAGTCVAGEPTGPDEPPDGGVAPPTAEFVLPVADAQLPARAEVELVATMAQGIASVELMLVSNRGNFPVVLPPPEWTDADRRGVRVRAEVELWRAGEGAVELVATFVPAAAPVTPFTIRRTVQVSVPAAAVAITMPAEDGFAVRGTFGGSARATAEIPLEQVTVQFLEQSSTQATFDPGLHGLTAEFQFDTTSVSAGERELMVAVRDALGRTAEARRRVVVDNVPLDAGYVGSASVFPGQPGDLEIEFTKPLAGPPAVSAPAALLEVGAVTDLSGGRRWNVRLLSAGVGEETVVVQVTGRDLLGGEKSVDAQVRVDSSPPRLVEPMVERRSPAGATLTFACHEDATYEAHLVSGPSAHGLCPRTADVVTVASAVARVSLTDAVGNTAEFVPSLVIEELAPVLGAVAATRGAEGLLHLMSPPPGAAADADGRLSEADGQVREFAVSSAPAGSTVRARPAGPMRRSSGRPVAWRDDETEALRLLMPDKAGHSWWELDGDAGTASRLAPEAVLSEVGPPAWAPALRLLVGASRSELFTVGLRGRRTRVRPVALTPEEVQETIVCGNVYVGAAVANLPQSSGGSARQLSLFAAALDVSTPADPSTREPFAADATVRLTCDGDDAIVFVGTDSELSIRRYARARGWTTDAPATSPLPRRDFLTSRTGLFGGGRRAAEYVADIWRYAGGSFQSAGAAGPARAKGVLLEDGARILAVGGEAAAGPSLLVASSSDDFAETPYVAPRLAGGESWDFTRNVLVALGPDPQHQRELWEWSPAQGWTMRLAISERAGGHVAYLPNRDGTLVFGGKTGTNLYVTSEFLYRDGAIASGPDVSDLRGAYGRASPLAGGRVALFRPDTSAIGTTAFVSAPFPSTGTWSRASYSLGVFSQLVAQVPGRDEQWGTALERNATNPQSVWSLVRGAYHPGTSPRFDSAAGYRWTSEGPVLTLPWTADRFLDGTTTRAVGSGAALGNAGLPDHSHLWSEFPGFLAIAQNVAPPPAKRMYVSYPSIDPPVWEVSEDAAPALYAELPAGEVEVDLCASDDRLVSGAIVAWLVEDQGVELLTPVAGGVDCRRFELRRTFAAPASLFVAVATDDEAVELRVDQLRIRTFTRR